MAEPDNFLSAKGIDYRGTLNKTKKASSYLQPIYEAFTNSLESIKLSGLDATSSFINIQLNFVKTLTSDEQRNFDFKDIVIQDNGIGFNEIEFDRFQNLNNDTKGFNNKGSGRIQYLHYFEVTEFTSIYSDINSETKFSKISFSFSKSESYLRKNSVINLKENTISLIQQNNTTVRFLNPISENDKKNYERLTPLILKDSLISHYLYLFCEDRTSLPKITIEMHVDEVLIDSQKIETSDIPEFDKTTSFNLFYYQLREEKELLKTDKTESFTIQSFKIKKDLLSRNSIKLVSKGEIVQTIKIDCLGDEEIIDGFRYMFLITSDYFDKNTNDGRASIEMLTSEEILQQPQVSLFDVNGQILLNHLQDESNNTIQSMYEEIQKKKLEKDEDIEKLRKMFLLSKEIMDRANIKHNDSEEKILEKVYETEAKQTARKDAAIKRRIDNLDNINPLSENYMDQLDKEINELVRTIPLQNRNTLTQYIARRKLVLSLFEKANKRQLQIQNSNDRAKDEKILHNILFQQGSEKPEDSDLWLINEDFIYFSGVSESKLSQVKVDDKLLFKQEFDEKEEEFLNSLGEDRLSKRPDVLLFPSEGKCIIIEFKALDVNVSKYLTQINRYASLIRNYSIDEIQITTFYGYLIGEAIDNRDVLGQVSSFEESYQFDYLYQPSQKVTGFDGRQHGSIYTEVIKYSTLLERAKKRNEVFIKKLNILE